MYTPIMPSRSSYFSAVSYYKDRNTKSTEESFKYYDEDDVEDEDTFEEYYDEVSFVIEADFEEEVYMEEPMEEDYRISLEEQIAKELMAEKQDEIVPVLKVSSKPTEKEMQEEYERYCEMRRKERKEEQEILMEKEKELSDWAFSIGICVNSIPGTFEERYTEMKEQKRIQLIQATDRLREERKEREEKERMERLEILKKNSEAVASYAHISGKERAKKKANACNVKGNLQGDKKGKSKKVKRAEAKKAEKERRMVQTVEKKVSGNQLVPQIDLGEEEEEEEVYIPPVKLAPWANLKPVKVDPVKVDPVKVDPVKVDPVKVDPVKVDDTWTTYSKKKPVKPAPKVEHHPSNKSLVRTRMCNSVYEKTTCRYGDKCLFAHKVSDMVKKPCAHDSECKLVEQLSEGVYQNTHKFTCSFWHPEETEMSYASRLKIPCEMFVVENKFKHVPKVVVKPVPSKIAPWAKVPTPTPVPIPATTPVPTTPVPTTPVPTTPVPVYEEGMTLILTRDELKNAVEQVLSKGIKKFRIELRN
jgi:hypothetical protein